MYMYTNDYDDRDAGWDASTLLQSPFTSQQESVPARVLSPDSMQDACSTSLNNACVYAVAEKYDIQGLKQLAKSKFYPIFCREGFIATLREVISTASDVIYVVLTRAIGVWEHTQQ